MAENASEEREDRTARDRKEKGVVAASITMRMTTLNSFLYEFSQVQFVMLIALGIGNNSNDGDSYEGLAV